MESGGNTPNETKKPKSIESTQLGLREIQEGTEGQRKRDGESRVMAIWRKLVFLILLIPGLILQYLKQLRAAKHYPPGPLRLPIIGGVWRLGFQLSKDSLIKLAKQYGNIYTIWVGNTPGVIISGFQAMKEGLINCSEAFKDRAVTAFLKEAIKERGTVFSNGRTWKQQRRFGQVTMRRLGLGNKALEHQIEEMVQELVQIFAQAKGQPLDPMLPITNSVSNVICALAFGHRFSLEDKEFLKMMEALETALKFITRIFHAMYEIFPHSLKHLPGPHQKAFLSIETMLSFAKKEVERHKKHHSRHEPQDFIDFYLLQMDRSKGDPESTYHEDNLCQTIVDLFVAGTDTTAGTLHWALLLMASYPDIQEKVRKEIADVFDSTQTIHYQDQKKLPYTNAVIHEIMRYKYVLLFGLTRKTVEDVNMLGCFIPKGTFIVPDMRSVLFDPKEWETPEEFNPHHFLDKEGRFVQREAFLPFGAGLRVCLGEQLARIEIFIFFTNLVRAFTFRPPEGVKELKQEPVIGLTTHPQPYKLCAIPICDTTNYENN